MPVSSCFRTPFASTRIHRSQTLLQPALQRFYPNFSLIQNKVRWKTSPLLRSTILGLFGNPFTADRMYFHHRCEKLQQHLSKLLSQKRTTFSPFFVAFLESRQNFVHFGKKDQLHSVNISEVIDPDKCGSFNASKLLFQNTLPQ